MNHTISMFLPVITLFILLLTMLYADEIKAICRFFKAFGKCMAVAWRMGKALHALPPEDREAFHIAAQLERQRKIAALKAHATQAETVQYREL